MEENLLTIGISTRALFDLDFENEIFENQGAKAYVDYQVAHESEVLKKGPAFSLIEAFLKLNENRDEPICQVIIMPKNSADSILRIFNSIEAYSLPITKAAITTGAPIAPYLKAYGVDLYLSTNEEDVKAAVRSGTAAATIVNSKFLGSFKINQIRIAFDGDCVLFSDEAENIFREDGLEAFGIHEKEQAKKPLPKGPFASLLNTIVLIQSLYPDPEDAPIRTALITARMAPAHERVIRTLRYWGLRIDEAHFLGGMDKTKVLEAFGAHIFFDDNEDNVLNASSIVLSAKVPTAACSSQEAC